MFTVSEFSVLVVLIAGFLLTIEAGIVAIVCYIRQNKKYALREAAIEKEKLQQAVARNKVKIGMLEQYLNIESYSEFGYKNK